MVDDQTAGNDYISDVEIHLIRAGRELLAAARTFIDGLDAALEALEQRVESGSKPQPAVEPIPIRRNTS